jgi:hypothetical protein
VKIVFDLRKGGHRGDAADAPAPGRRPTAKTTKEAK